MIARSTPDRPVPDLFCYALLADFRGYKPDYSKVFPAHRNYLTWVVLKAHTANTAGEVTLRSSNPRDTPLINFRYFEEGNDARQEDLKAVVQGIKLVRKLGEKLRQQGRIAEEEEPGPVLDDDTKLMEYVQNRAWGHHASCTCAIGARDRGGVLSGDFKVHGVEGLRVVDASVFPRARAVHRQRDLHDWREGRGCHTLRPRSGLNNDILGLRIEDCGVRLLPV